MFLCEPDEAPDYNEMRTDLSKPQTLELSFWSTGGYTEMKEYVGTQPNPENPSGLPITITAGTSYCLSLDNLDNPYEKGVTRLI